MRLKLCILIYSIWIAFISAVYVGCKDSEPPPFDRHDAGQLGGFWYRDTNAEWTYLFNLWETRDGSQGHLQIRRIAFGAEIVDNEYSVRTRNDTVFLTDIHNTDNKRVWIVEFLSDSSCQVDEKSNTPLWFHFPLKRF